MFNLSDTICAICTPPGIGSISVIRLSGTQSWEIIKDFFKSNKEISFKHMVAQHGFINESGNQIDEVIVLPFKAPNSFTAEDIIEINCHGGPIVTSMVLDLCLKHGARQAQRGEFTFRAFINGRIDLTEAEAVNEIIHAENSRSVTSASDLLTGKLKIKVNNFRNKIFDLITSIESVIEFPQDVPQLDRETITKGLNEINKDLKELIEDSKEGQLIRDGIKVSIIGAPNAGKSSLLNQLIESNRAIVTNEPGTTRDTLEEKFIIDGYTFVFIDTAGIRKTKELNESEKIGIERSKLSIEKADLVLLLYDLTNQTTNSEYIASLVNGKQKITIGNKIDLMGKEEKRSLSDENYDIFISAKEGTNINDLKKLIIEKTKSQLSTNKEKRNSIYINQRQKELLLQCSSSIDYTIQINRKLVPEDLIADELKKTVSLLDEITGRKVSDDIIKNIFTKFCIGK